MGGISSLIGVVCVFLYIYMYKILYICTFCTSFPLTVLIIFLQKAQYVWNKAEFSAVDEKDTDYLMGNTKIFYHKKVSAAHVLTLNPALSSKNFSESFLSAFLAAKSCVCFFVSQITDQTIYWQISQISTYTANKPTVTVYLAASKYTLYCMLGIIQHVSVWISESLGLGQDSLLFLSVCQYLNHWPSLAMTQICSSPL